MNDTEIIQLNPTDSQSLALVTSDRWVRSEWQAEQFARYEAAVNAGLINKLCQMTLQHGTKEASAFRWVVTDGDVTLELKFFHHTAGMEIVRNGETILNDCSGDVIFEVGQGKWLESLLLEHSHLERIAVQAKRLAERVELNAAEQRRNRNI